MTISSLIGRRSRTILLLLCAAGILAVMAIRNREVLTEVTGIMMLAGSWYAIAWLVAANEETSRGGSGLHLAVGSVFGLILSVPPIGAFLVLVALWCGGVFWLPLLSIPSFVYLWRTERLRAGLCFVTGATVTFTPIFYLLVFSNEFERNSATAFAAWVAFCVAASAAPLSLGAERRWQSRRAA